eukprot:TRINITY_DN1582_c0_g1_i3.p1 TRINITY_DN1582_c0_g1~~TRINITY_DN1582_c0_g1_i3.p1  ORF type:complete len:298 (-),score=43.22 TRINITY_DN1582_c0_g1_i3:694-1587(-)
MYKVLISSACLPSQRYSHYGSLVDEHFSISSLPPHILQEHFFPCLEMSDLRCLTKVSKAYNQVMNTHHPLFKYTQLVKTRIKPSDWKWKMCRVAAILKNGDWILVRKFLFCVFNLIPLTALFLVIGTFVIVPCCLLQTFNVDIANYGFDSLIDASLAYCHTLGLSDIKRSKKEIYVNNPSTKKLVLLNLIWLFTVGLLFAMLFVLLAIVHCATVIGIFEAPKYLRLAYYHLWPMEYDFFEVAFAPPLIPLSDPFADFMFEMKRVVKITTPTPTIDDYTNILEEYALRNQKLKPEYCV